MVPGYAACVCSTDQSHLSLLKFNDPYDVDKAFQGSSSIPATDEGSLDLSANLDELFEVMEASPDQEEG